MEDATLFGCVLWSIWKQRNNKLWNGVVDTQTYVVNQVKTMLYEWLVACLMRNTSLPKQASNVKWTKPTTERFKCSIYVSFSKQTNRDVTEGCIRDDTCFFLCG
jgi:hypothetical protein